MMRAYERATVSSSTLSSTNSLFEGAAETGGGGGGGGGERSVAKEGTIAGGMGAGGEDADAGGGAVVGIALLVFVLSAVVPSRTRRFLERVFEVVEAGGRVCFRDYGRELVRGGGADYSSSVVYSCEHTTPCPPFFRRVHFPPPSSVHRHPNSLSLSLSPLGFHPSLRHAHASI